MKKLILASLVILTGATACYKDNAEDMYPGGGGSTGGCDTTNVTYSGTIEPIIHASCATAGCHFDASVTGIDLFHYSGVAAMANSGKLVSAITHNGQASPMPKGMPKLDDCKIAKIVKWVNSGAPNN